MASQCMDRLFDFFWGPAFWFIAIVVSLFYGLKCWTIHELDLEVGLWDLTQRWKFSPKQLWRTKTWAWKSHQVWLNFLGSLIGWYALWLFHCGRRNHCPLSWPDIAILAIALLGMTGFIPHVSRYGSKLIHDIASKG